MSSVRIDGRKIRSLRERQELTQLYLATVVEVTTDTISRWENRRYPAIKLENARKLAEALDVTVDELLEERNREPAQLSGQEIGADDQPVASSVARPGPLSRFFQQNKKMAAAVFAVALMALFVFWAGSGGNSTLIARRVLPEHAAPNMPFPVAIHIEGKRDFGSPLLIREELIGDSEATGQGEDGKRKKFGRHPRWIGKMEDGHAVFAYTVIPDKGLAEGDEIVLSGDIVTQQGRKEGKKIIGPDRIRIAPYHWADVNGDYVISDNEILMAYETYSTPEESGMDFTFLEELWLAGGYSWNKKIFFFEKTAASTGKE
ncbi:MAG: helix-turn-helix domain-containing protein [Desulfobulbaceae bacterium]|nr:helix-turn-helix domain-containing protein [Desulfobulbaceae bacterium]